MVLFCRYVGGDLSVYYLLAYYLGTTTSKLLISLVSYLYVGFFCGNGCRSVDRLG